MTTPCLLCDHGELTDFCEDRRRPYLRCESCRLIVVPQAYHLSAAAEKAEYDKHENDPSDTGYRQFLSRLAEPLAARLPDGAHGLDFGCGPGPTLSVMLQEQGFSMDVYDPFYQADKSVFQRRYDFITATEVLEHLRTPQLELARLWRLLQPGGLLAIMTKQALDRDAFMRWHYKNDPTHICFFSRQTFQWLATHWHATLTFHHNDVAILQKQRDLE